MQTPAIVSVLAVLAAALSGCVGQAPADGSATTPQPLQPASQGGGTGTGPGSQAGAGAGPAPAGGAGQAPAQGSPAALRPLALHLQADLGLREEPPAEDARVTLTTPVNGPMTTGYPSWAGELPGDVELGEGGVPLTFYVTASTASLAAGPLVVFEDVPGFFVGLAVGELRLHARVDGPPVLLAGEVHEVAAMLVGDVGRVPAGAPVELYVDVIYTHVAGAAEFQYALGPEHAARLGFNGAP